MGMLEGSEGIEKRKGKHRVRMREAREQLGNTHGTPGVMMERYYVAERNRITIKGNHLEYMENVEPYTGNAPGYAWGTHREKIASKSPA